MMIRTMSTPLARAMGSCLTLRANTLLYTPHLLPLGFQSSVFYHEVSLTSTEACQIQFSSIRIHTCGDTRCNIRSDYNLVGVPSGQLTTFHPSRIWRVSAREKVNQSRALSPEPLDSQPMIWVIRRLLRHPQGQPLDALTLDYGLYLEELGRLCRKELASLATLTGTAWACGLRADEETGDDLKLLHMCTLPSLLPV